VSKKKIRLAVSGLIFIAFLGIQIYKQYYPSKDILSVTDNTERIEQIPNTYIVSKVVDGDTLNVSVNGKALKVRVIGINTPEIVDLRRPVQCFGKEASERAKSILLNKAVRLEADPTQGDMDRYQRLLRYVFLPNDIDYGFEMIKQGFAYEYTYDTPYKYQEKYKDAQIAAENSKAGLWSDTSCRGKN